MSADCPGCWPTPKLPITRVTPREDDEPTITVTKHTAHEYQSREIADEPKLDIDQARLTHYCATPPEADIGDTYPCPTCGTTWRATHDEDRIDEGLYFVWTPDAS